MGSSRSGPRGVTHTDTGLEVGWPGAAWCVRGPPWLGVAEDRILKPDDSFEVIAWGQSGPTVVLDRAKWPTRLNLRAQVEGLGGIMRRKGQSAFA